MAILVHTTKQAIKDCKTHGMGSEVLAKFAERIESSQMLEVFERNNPFPVLVKKQFYGFDKRLVAIQKYVQQDTVIVLLRVLIRGSAEYTDHFEGRASAEATLRYVDKQYRAELSDDVMNEIVVERNRKDPPTKLPDVSDVENEFLWSQAYPGDTDDTMVCETHEFVEDLKRPQLRNQMIRLPDMIAEAVTAEPRQVVVIRSQSNLNLCLLAYNSPETEKCMILRLIQDTKASVDMATKQWQERLADANVSKILRYCRVSYPSLICGDEQIWISIHGDADDSEAIANLSLSPEEGDILNSCNSHEGENSGFPLFINGRAGSGKSTLLQYLFAFSFRRWLKTLGATGEVESCPLYLASSGTLLDVAHRASKSILSLNSNQVISGLELDDSSKISLEGCFKKTSTFMHSMLPLNSARKYLMENRIDYARFRRMWDQQFSNEPKAIRDYGPQISWHIIRGLLKGFSSTEILAEDEFDALPKDERSVSKETFKLVYERVWENWYREICSENAFWDDQDLVLHLIQNDLLPRTHVAIFCDEAQDFTRVELEAIYRCSLFSNRTLTSQCVSRIPFVFAGDPFQTLNPTGFRWESVQSGFTERILSSLHRFGHKVKVPVLHYEELTYNYRSAKRIVHFCNTIQASRATLFDHTSLRPQETWRIQDDQNAPVFLDMADVQVKQSLKGQNDLVLIIPCEEGEEIEYVSKDCYLKEIVDLDDDSIPLNVQSAARAKGLEFKRVALYGWSKRPEAKRIAELLKSTDESSVELDEKLQLEYFMNNLYVAASRAQRRLFIIDEKESRSGLWWIVDDEEHLNKLVSNLSSDWKNQIGTMVDGGNDSFQHDKDTNKRRAEQQKIEGMSKRSTFTLKQAARYFELDANMVEANRCRGFAHLYAQRFVEAARHFEAAGDAAHAVAALWQGKLFVDLAELASRVPQHATLPECQVAIFLVDQLSTARECVELLQSVKVSVEADPKMSRSLRDSSWSSAFEKVLRKILPKGGDDSTNATGPSADLIVEPLSELIHLGLEIGTDVQASLHFAARNYEKVIELLRDDPSSATFRDAKALSSLLRSNRGEEISDTDAGFIGEYMLRQPKPDFKAASFYFLQAGALGRQFECLRAAREFRDINDEMLAEVIRNAIEGTLRHSDWANLVGLIRYGKPASSSEHNSKKKTNAEVDQRVLRIVSEKGMHWKFVLPFLAESARLSDDTGQEKQKVQEYLKALILNQDWRKNVSAAVMGSAIERAGKDVDALIFYEDLRDRATEAREKKYAEIRWVICKLRQAARQNSEANRKEAQKVMDKYGWDEAIIRDEYPDLKQAFQESKPNLQPISDGTTAVIDSPKLKNRERTKAGKLEFHFLQDKGWINIESDGLQARVLILDKLLESTDVSIVKLENGSYVCEDWDLVVVWLGDNSVALKHAGQEWVTS